MTVKDLYERLEDFPLEAVLYAFNGDHEEVMPVTGFLYTPRQGLKPPRLEFQTDVDP